MFFKESTFLPLSNSLLFLEKYGSKGYDLFWVLFPDYTQSPCQDSTRLYLTDTAIKKSQGGMWKQCKGLRIQQT